MEDVNIKISGLIEKLEKLKGEYGDLNVVIHVPGDDVGYWEIDDNKNIVIDRYEDHKSEKFVKINIY